MAICRIKEKMKYPPECSNDAWEEDPDGLCLLHSRQDNKGKDGKFSEAVKQKLEKEDYKFRGAYFPGLNDFAGYKFTKDVDFSRVTFHSARFFLAKFVDASFSRAVFHDVDFAEANFHGVSFFMAKFQNADFSLASFNNANFSEATFQEAAFYGTTFQKASTM